jgi:YidC/Oxa1 family membrane protein insertase
MDNKRLVIWMLLTLATLYLLGQAQRWFFPPQPQAANAPNKEETKPTAPKPKPLTPAEQTAVQLALFRGLVPNAPPFLVEWGNDSQHQQLLIKEFSRQRVAQRKQQQPAGQLVTLGDLDKTKIYVQLSERQAAVKNITLTQHFRATHDYGKPDPEHRRLLLVSDEEDIRGEAEERQSFRLLVGKEDLEWRLESVNPEKTKAVFVADVPGKPLRVRKTYTLQPQAYHMDLEISFEPTGGATAASEISYELTGPRGLPVEAMKWRQLPFRYVVTCLAKPGEPNRPVRFLDDHAKIAKGDLQPRTLTDAANPTNLVYAGVMLQYFAALIVVDRQPDQDQPSLIESIQYENLGDDKDAAPFQAATQGRVSFRLVAKPFKVEPKQAVTHKYLLYAGPTKPLLLNYEKDTEPGLADKYISLYHLNTMTDYSWFAWTGALGLTTIFVFFTNLMHRLLENLYWIFGSYGVAIIIMTAIVRLLMHPISRKQFQSSHAMSTRMAKLKPEIAKLKEKFKNDKQALGMAQWELMKKHGVNPFASCTGCLVVLVQMPIFMGLYYALNESMHLRLASFLWMPNLAAPDMLVNWSNWPVLGWLGRGFPIFGMYFHLGDFLLILPIISVVLMYIHQKAVAPPAMDEQQEMQMKMMNYMMFFFAYMFYWVPSGLCLYFIVSSGWGLLERKFLLKKPEDKKELAVVTTKDGKPGKEVRTPVKESSPNGIKAKLSAWWEKVLKEAEKKR